MGNIAGTRAFGKRCQGLETWSGGIRIGNFIAWAL